MEQILVANDEHTLGQPCRRFLGAFNPFHDQGTGSAAENGDLAETVDMRVIPVEAGRLIRRDAEPILEWRVAGL